jgi:hypothetical protein
MDFRWIGELMRGPEKEQKWSIIQPGMVVRSYHHSAPEAEEEDGKFEASLSHIVRLCLKMRTGLQLSSRVLV